MNVVNKKKLHNSSKFSVPTILGSLRRSFEIKQQAPECRVIEPFKITGLPRASSNQQFQTELELSRNNAVLYANMLPPR